MSKDVRIVVIEVGDDDDDEKKRKGGGPRPNTYWQRIREEQEHDDEPDPDTFSGSYRGVKPAPHGGVATVRPEQILGADELCWCGQILGHDWPGKARGRKHPKEGTAMKVATGTLDRRDLRAYHQRLQDFILQCVNNDGLKFRLAKNSLILYPPDGTAPVTVNARSGDRQLRQLQKWYVAHVYEEPTADQPADPEALARLAEVMNDPTEHPVKKAERQVEDELRGKEPQDERPPVAPQPEAAAEEEPVPEPDENAVWTPYIRGDGKGVSPNMEITEGGWIRCRLCLDTDHPMLSRNPRSMGGHNRIYHTNTEGLYSKEARERAVETARLRKHSIEKIAEVIQILMDMTGFEPPVREVEKIVEVQVGDTEETERLRVENETLKGENASLRQKVEEHEAKAALLREALSL